MGTKKSYLLLILSVCLNTISPAQTKPLTLNNEIKLWKNDKALEHAGIGIYLFNPETNKVLAEITPQLSLVPASTLKLITTATALEILGSNFRFETKLAYSGTIRNDSLIGNLIIIGGGDPALGSKYFKKHYLNYHFLNKWLNQITQLNIKHITGDIITDISIFDDQMIPRTWIWEDMGNYYGAGSCGLSVYDNLYKIHFSSANEAGKQTQIRYTEPFIPELTIDNQVKSSDINRDLAYVFGAPMENKRTIRGSIPKGRKDFVIKASIPNPAYLIAYDLKSRIAASNITIDGSIRIKKNRQDNSNLKLIAKTVSPKLIDIIRVTNHESVNLFAEHLIKYLSYLITGQGSTEQGVRVITDFWDKQGIDMDGLFMVDGSGLSRFNSMTAKQMVQILSYMKTQSNEGDAFFSSLPYVPNGTLYFFKPINFPGHSLRAKSGSMTRVRCYAGELTNRHHQKILFAIFMNNFSCSQRKAIQLVENLLFSISKH